MYYPSLLGDESKPRSWSKYAPDSSAYKQKNQGTVENKKEKKESQSQTSNPLKKELADKVSGIIMSTLDSVHSLLIRRVF